MHTSFHLRKRRSLLLLFPSLGLKIPSGLQRWPTVGAALAAALYKLIKALEYETANPDPEESRSSASGTTMTGPSMSPTLHKNSLIGRGTDDTVEVEQKVE